MCRSCLVLRFLLWDPSGTPWGNLFATVRDSGAFLGNPRLQNVSSEHPKNNPPSCLPAKRNPRCSFVVQAGPKMAQALPKVQTNTKREHRKYEKPNQEVRHLHHKWSSLLTCCRPQSPSLMLIQRHWTRLGREWCCVVCLYIYIYIYIKYIDICVCMGG